MMKKAFTLIEILVALAIIALITGASFSAFSGARMSARDAKRKADLESIRSALELYRNQNGGYPANTGLLTSGQFMTQYPPDPVSGNQYIYTPSGSTSYVLCSHLEISPAVANDVSNCGSCGGTCKYKTTNP